MRGNSRNDILLSMTFSVPLYLVRGYNPLSQLEIEITYPTQKENSFFTKPNSMPDGKKRDYF